MDERPGGEVDDCTTCAWIVDRRMGGSKNSGGLTGAVSLLETDEQGVAVLAEDECTEGCVCVCVCVRVCATRARL